MQMHLLSPKDFWEASKFVWFITHFPEIKLEAQPVLASMVTQRQISETGMA